MTRSTGRSFRLPIIMHVPRLRHCAEGLLPKRSKQVPNQLRPTLLLALPLATRDDDAGEYAPSAALIKEFRVANGVLPHAGLTPAHRKLLGVQASASLDPSSLSVPEVHVPPQVCHPRLAYLQINLLHANANSSRLSTLQNLCICHLFMLVGSWGRRCAH